MYSYIINKVYRVFHQQLKIPTPGGIQKSCLAQVEAAGPYGFWCLQKVGPVYSGFAKQTHPLTLQMTSALWKMLPCARTGQCNEPTKRKLNLASEASFWNWGNEPQHLFASKVDSALKERETTDWSCWAAEGPELRQRFIHSKKVGTGIPKGKNWKHEME